MKDDEATNAIFQRFIDVWPTLTAVPYVFEDEGADDVTRYVRVQKNSTVSVQKTLGANPGNLLVERHGTVKVKVNVPSDEGRTATPDGLDLLIRYVKAVFEFKRFGAGASPAGVICMAGSDRTVGVEGRYFTAIVDVAYRYDDVV